ncbi:MAG: phenylalanine--tRNA ligase subunit alpha, partial [Chitinophagaceae bacterium]
MLQELEKDLKNIKQKIEQTTVQTAEELEHFRIQYLGNKGMIRSLFEKMKYISTEHKKEAGKILNKIKQLCEQYYQQKKDSFVIKFLNTNECLVDYSLPSIRPNVGNRHPLMQTQNEMIRIFKNIGFSIAEGPEIEDDWHNFTALNMDENHPARDMQDTFYINFNPDILLRTHTSSVQIRSMKEGNLPLRIIAPGRVFRNETISARSNCFFHQIEGLYVAENVSFADLKQTLYYFVQALFKADIKTRFRASYFPFTEPSAEMDVNCFICGGKGCNV